MAVAPAKTMRIFGLAGWSGSGKTTLIVRLIPELASRGLSVSTLKHAHHEFDIDRPGKDSHAHRQAGALRLGAGVEEALQRERRLGRTQAVDQPACRTEMAAAELEIPPRRLLASQHHQPHAREALCAAQAGRKGAVTIATNMAGRGTDILLGGNPDFLFKKALYADPEMPPERQAALLHQIRAECEEEKKEVVSLGGLHILGRGIDVALQHKLNCDHRGALGIDGAHGVHAGDG